MEIESGVKDTFNIQVKGLVQGVGFRPFIYLLAREFKLKGWVENRNDCVQIKVQGEPQKIDKFISSIKKISPEASNIESILYKTFCLFFYIFSLSSVLSFFVAFLNSLIP